PRLAKEAPDISLVTTRPSAITDEELRTGRVDAYFGSWSKIPPYLHQFLLRHEGFACIARRGHPRTRKSRLTPRAYTELEHVVVTQEDWPGGVVDTALADQGLGRRESIRTPHFLVAAQIVARSDAIATLPRGVAAVLARCLPLDVLRPPVDVSTIPIHMVWHPRTHEEAPHRWL